jgi:endoglucanase
VKWLTAVCIGLLCIGGCLLGLAVSAQARPTVHFRFNQLGYPASASKRLEAITSGPLVSRRFTVIGAGGRVVLRGRATGPVRWNRHYLVYTLDLSGLRAPGSYRVRFAGARSPALRVAAAATLYKPLTAFALNFLQSQRDGPEVIAGSLHREPSHLRDDDATVYTPPSYRGETLVDGLTATGAHADVAGGWFDAGDYLKFVETASFTDAVLLFTLRTYPTGVANRAALEAEARFGTNWLLRMWNQSERVLYYQVGLGAGNGSTILGDHDLWRLPQADEAHNPQPGSPTYYETYRPVFAANAPGAPISPNLAGRVAAAFALCAQVFATSDPAYAHRCLLAGQTLYDQANTAPGELLLTTSPYVFYNETEWRDDLELGATELYLATQRALADGAAAGLPHTELAYYLRLAGDWANAYIEAPDSGEDSLNLYDVSTLADYDLVQILATPVAQELARRVEVPTSPESLLEDRQDQLHLGEQLARQEPFGMANPATNLDTVAHALGYAVQARMYDELAHTGAFAAFAQQQLDWVLGANAWGSSFVVGVGSVYPHCLAAQIPNLAGSLSGRGAILRGAILRGATVEGPTAPSGVRGLELPEGARRCSVGGFARLDGHGLSYLDDVRSPTTSEPTDDLAVLTLLASAQLAAGG